MTYEFDFPGGSAIITTTTGGTIDAPDFCVSGPDGAEFNGQRDSVFAAELLRRSNESIGIRKELLAEIDRILGYERGAWKSLRDALDRIWPAVRSSNCVWRQDYDYDAWDTKCGNTFCLDSGPPSENDMRFCCYCGRPLEEQLFEPDEEEEESDVHD